MKKLVKFEPWSGLCVSILVLLTLYCVFGYSGGYGKIVDGKLDASIRVPLLFEMRADYKRDDGEWSFGQIVPFAVLGLFWFKRKELMGTKCSPALIGGGLICLLSLLVYWAGYRGHQKYFGYASGQLLVAGMIIWFLGWAWFGRILWLWILLGMMWPWRFLIGRISSPLQGIMVKLTSEVLELVGVDAYAHGSELRTGTKDPETSQLITLDVDVECSGMRSLFALVMLGMVFSFLRVNKEWKRWVVMSFVPFAAILGNLVRMLLLYFGSASFGTRLAIGESHENSSPYHIGAGLMVFAVALAILMGVTYFVEKGPRVLRKNLVRRTVTRVVGGEEE